MTASSGRGRYHEDLAGRGRARGQACAQGAAGGVTPLRLTSQSKWRSSSAPVDSARRHPAHESASHGPTGTMLATSSVQLGTCVHRRTWQARVTPSPPRASRSDPRQVARPWPRSSDGSTAVSFYEAARPVKTFLPPRTKRRSAWRTVPWRGPSPFYTRSTRAAGATGAKRFVRWSGGAI